MKRILTLVSLSLSLLALAGCDSYDSMQWAPDGKTFTIVNNDTLILGTPDGKLSQSLVPNADFSRWLPDSKHALVVTERKTKSWPEIAKLLTQNEQQDVKAMAKKVWQKHNYFENQPYQAESFIYLKHTYGDAAFKLRFKKLLADLGGDLPSLEIDEVKLVDISDPNTPKRQLLFASIKSIDDVQISPNGKMAAVEIVGNSKTQILVLPLTAENGATTTAAINAGSPDWSKDGTTLFYVTSTDIDGHMKYADVLEKTPESYQEKIMSVQVVDTAGRLLPKPKVAHTVATVMAADTHQLRCLQDGSLIFDGKQKSYPSIGEQNTRSLLFRIKPDLKTLETINGSGDLPEGGLDTFEPNKDGSLIATHGNKGDVNVLQVDSGKVIKLEPAREDELSFAPKWRGNDELCFLSKQEKAAGGHDYDLVLQSVKDLNQRTVLSKNWSAKDFPFLEKKDETATEKVKARSAK